MKVIAETYSARLQQLAWLLLALTLFALTQWAHAAADMEINTSAISAIKSSMQARHGQLAAHYNAGAVGLTGDGLIAVRDATAMPLKDRAGIGKLVAEENADRNDLYKEIAKANGHPEWEGEVRHTFAERWIDKAQSGWYYKSGADWARK